MAPALLLLHTTILPSTKVPLGPCPLALQVSTVSGQGVGNVDHHLAPVKHTHFCFPGLMMAV